MSLTQLLLDIQNRRKLGESYNSIGRSFGIKQGMAWQIAHGYKPGKRVSAILQLEPDCNLKYTRSRREGLNEIAQRWGFASWSEFETYQLKSNDTKAFGKRKGKE
jgi:hypothetical protein